MNTKLLRKIQKHTLAEPKRLDMNAYILRADEIVNSGRVVPKCGTVGCIAGWAVTLSTPHKIAYSRISEYAQRLLKLTDSQANRLFHDANWPFKFSFQLEGAQSQTLKHAKVVSARIDHFIKTKGKE